MDIFLLFMILVTLFESLCFAKQESPHYIYPVASYKRHDNMHLLVCQQWTPDNVELYDLDMATSIMTKTLMSRYIPAAVMMLPDQSGFSFVDNGRIRIKRFEKRAVRTLDIYEPIYGIELVNWLDNETCYFHAMSDGYFGIYTLTLEEDLVPLLAHESIDYMYPVILDSRLFFIERNKENASHSYTVRSCRIDGPDRNISTITACGSNPIVLLRMTTLKEGSFIECDTLQELYTFHYHRLVETCNHWENFSLFSFQIPRQFFVDGPSRVYESLLPFAPYKHGENIYFSSYNKKTGHMALYCYSLKTGSTECLAQRTSWHIFGARCLGDTLIVGGTAGSLEQLSLNHP